MSICAFAGFAMVTRKTSKTAGEPWVMLRMIQKPPVKVRTGRDCGAHYICVVGLRPGAVERVVERGATEMGI